MSLSHSHRTSGRININHNLPIHSSAIQEKLHLHNLHGSGWTKPVSLPIPGVRNRRLRLCLPNFSYFQRRKRGPLLLFCICVFAVFSVVGLVRRLEGKNWIEPPTRGEPPTLVFTREHLQRIWGWEVESGHFPSRDRIPREIGLKSTPSNPALPPQRVSMPSRFRPPSALQTLTDTLGVGPQRVYLDIQSRPPNVAYPPRPVPGSAADLDIVMKHCDFSEKKYVRDCLEVLRIGGGLDNGNRMRRGEMDDWKYIYVEKEVNDTQPTKPDNSPIKMMPRPVMGTQELQDDPNAGLMKKRGAEWEAQLTLPPKLEYRPHASQASLCDDDNPRIFHMFWTGPFTDKPYNALLSFLYTQNTGLHLQNPAAESRVCRPQFWLWINPGPAASVPNPSALHDMFEGLKSNAWAAPFLHPRFKDVIKFQLWNTTEQLDGVPELKDEWRALRETLFNSGGYVVSVPQNEQNDTSSLPSAASKTKSTTEDDIVNRAGSKSSDSYDRLSVILSDMARFILCHRFGGIYLDADTIFLRDWEELWGWKGAFAYRWSRLDKYNTAVLRMNKGSALGTFLFRTALKNGLDFHPMTVSRYTKDAYLEGLLLRLPDALFDSAWLNTEDYQRDRPPQPYFTEFADFFETPAGNSAAPQALGFEGFFRGAYSYHFHNFWWIPFDSSRNWPDLGPRFAVTEKPARAAALARARRMANAALSSVTNEDEAEDLDFDFEAEGWKDKVEHDKRDLDWATVLKRTFEAYIRGERPNMYGEWIRWNT